MRGDAQAGTCESFDHFPFSCYQLLCCHSYRCFFLLPSFLPLSLGNRLPNVCGGRSAGNLARSDGGSDGRPTKGVGSTRLNPFRGVPAPTDLKLVDVPVPLRELEEADVARDMPEEDVDVVMRYVGVGYRSTVVVKLVRLALVAAREHFLSVGGLNWDNLNVLDYIAEGSYTDVRRFACFSVKRHARNGFINGKSCAYRV